MLQVTISDSIDEDKNSEYPTMLTCDLFIVLFNKPKCGVIIYVADTSITPFKVGYYSTNWNMEEFKLVKKSVTLTVS